MYTYYPTLLYKKVYIDEMDLNYLRTKIFSFCTITQENSQHKIYDWNKHLKRKKMEILKSKKGLFYK